MQEARQRLGEMSFDVLITDLSLPDGDGTNLVRFAKERRQEIKAIALTGRTSDDERSAGLTAGFDHYLTKPIDMHSLRQAMIGAAEGKSEPRANSSAAVYD